MRGRPSPCLTSIRRGLKFMRQAPEAAGGREVRDQTDDTCHLNGAARMGDDPRTSVVDSDCRSWDIPDLWVCDGSAFPTVGGVNPSLTISAIACRTADRIRAMARSGSLWQPVNGARDHTHRGCGPSASARWTAVVALCRSHTGSR